MPELKNATGSWWQGINFSIGSQAYTADRNEILEEIAEFHRSVKKPADLDEDHDDLEERVKDFRGQWDDKIENDEDLVEALSNFESWFKQMKDPKSKFELLHAAIEGKISVMEAMTRSWGKTYNSEHQKYYPEEHGKKLPKAGGWVMILPEKIPVQYSPEQYTVYFAKPDPTTQEITPQFSETVKVPYYRVRITLEQGDLHLWPHEYVIITDITEIMKEVGTQYELVRLGGDTNYDSAKVHYLGTRGIGQSEVYEMLLGSVNSTTFCYFKLVDPKTREYYTFFFDCMDRGIRPEMVDRLWHCQQTGEPLFKVKYKIEGKEVTEDEFNAYKSKDRPEGDTSTNQITSEARSDDSSSGA